MNPPCILNYLNGHKGPVTSLSWHPTKNQFISGSTDNKMMLWTSIDGVCKSYLYSGHSNHITQVQYAPDGNLVASSSLDTTVRLWNTALSANGASLVLKASHVGIQTVSFTDSGKQLLTGSNDKALKLWDIEHGHKAHLRSFVGHTNWVLATQAVGDVVVSCGADSTIRVWDMRTGNAVHTLQSRIAAPTSISLHRNAKYVAVGMSNGSVRLYDMRTNNIHQCYDGVHDCTTSVNWHPKMNVLLSTGTDGKLLIIDLKKSELLYTIKPLVGSLRCCSVNQNGFFVFGSDEKKIMSWKLGDSLIE